MASTGALIFGIINIVGNFGTVFVDQSYWQRAIAARPQSAVRGFLLGGLAWFAIPFTIATTLGLSAIAFGVSLTPSEISNGIRQFRSRYWTRRQKGVENNIQTCCFVQMRGF